MVSPTPVTPRLIFTQNLILSGLIIVALIPLAGLGLLGLAAAVAAHELAEVLVVLNGIRTGRRRLLPAGPPARPASRPEAPRPTPPQGCRSPLR